MDTKDKSIESNAKGKNNEGDFSTLSLIVQCYNSQGYGYVVANCPRPIRVIDKLPVTKSESYSEESICQAEELEDSRLLRKGYE